MDRDQLTGITLILLILVVYTHFFGPKPMPQPAALAQEQTQEVQGQHHTSSAHMTQDAPPALTTQGVEQEVVLENEMVKVTLSSQGGSIKQVVLKQYKDPRGEPLVLLDAHSSHMGFQWAHPDVSLDSHAAFFVTEDKDQCVSGAEKAQATFLLSLEAGKYLKHTFSLSGQGYTLTHDWEIVGLGEQFAGVPLQFVWRNHIKQVEKDIVACRNKTTINYYLADRDTFDGLPERTDKPQEQLIHRPILWIGMKQRFFTAAVIADSPFADGYMATRPPRFGETTVKEAQVRLTLPETDAQQDRKGQFTFYFGPNDYTALRGVAPGFTKNLSLGWPVIRWINQLVILPLFTWLEKYISNYGIIIIVLVLLIKCLLFPLSYRSYVAMARMRVLQPELNAIKAKCGNDAQRMQTEQMSFYQEMGINPMSGCIPILLQMPILLAMFNFFPNAIALRQQPFLWASDLSTYDAVLYLPFRIPAYGSHVSLFTLLMTASTILYTRSNNQLNTSTGPQQPHEEALKIMTYLMPFTFMFILNSLPAGLSFYYFVSNLITFGQQSLIKYFVDEDVLKAKLEQRKKGRHKNANKPRAQWRLEAAKKRRQK